MDTLLNKWAEKLWDVCRIDEYYKLLGEFREEVLNAKEAETDLEGSNEEGPDPRQLALFPDGEGQ